MLLRAAGSHEGVLALLGLIHAGAVPVSVKPRVPGAVTGRYLATVADQQQARAAYRISGTGLAELDLRLSPGSARGGSIRTGEPADADPEQIAFVQYTSGSTGMPRPIPLSHRAVLANVRAIAEVAGMQPGHTGMVALPLHHDMGLVGMLSTLVEGISLVIEEPGTFLRRPMAALRLVREFEGRAQRLPRLHAPLPLRPDRRDRRDPRPGAAGPLAHGVLRRRTDPPGLGTRLPGADRALGIPALRADVLLRPGRAALMATAHRYQSDDASFHQEGPAAVACLGEAIPGLELALRTRDGLPCAEGELGRYTWRRNHVQRPRRPDRPPPGLVRHRRPGRTALRPAVPERPPRRPAHRQRPNIFVTDIEQQVMDEPGVEDCVVLPHDESFTVLAVAARNSSLDTAASRTGHQDFGVAPLSVREVRHSDIIRTASGKPARGQMTAQLEPAAGEGSRAMTSTGVGIAIASGMLKGVFGHGVLSAFEERGLRADVYGTASSSVLSGGLPRPAAPARSACATGSGPPRAAPRRA
ncbi:AMP-binding protein [Streptacidiphilus sp. 4-A2]|nr:AMP-binding protein [Streptacidiphilus sp. 4-A2]